MLYKAKNKKIAFSDYMGAATNRVPSTSLLNEYGKLGQAIKGKGKT